MKFALLLLACSLSAQAQLFEVGGFGGALRFSGRSLGSASSKQNIPVEYKDSWLFGFRMTTNSLGITGHEFGYSYHRSPISVQGAVTGTAIHNGLYNYLLYATPEGASVRPFAAGGANFSNFILPGGSVTSGGGQTKIGLNYGGGIKVRVERRFLVRFDVRQYLTGKPFDLREQSGLLRRLEISAGLSFVL